MYILNSITVIAVIDNCITFKVYYFANHKNTIALNNVVLIKSSYRDILDYFIEVSSIVGYK